MRHTSAWLYVLFAALYMLASPGVLNNPDSATRFLTATSLARKGTIKLDFPGLKLETYETARDAQGSWVEIFSEGQSVLLTPFLLAFSAMPGIDGSDSLKYYEFFTSVVVFPLLSALTVPAFLLLLRLFCPDDRVNLAACLLLGACTYYLVYAYNGHQEAQVSLLLIMHFYFLVRHFRERKKGLLLVAAAALGVIVMIRPNLVYYAPLSAIWLLCEYRRQGASWSQVLRAEALLAGTSFLVFSPQLYFNFLKTGHPLRLPYEGSGIGLRWQLSGSFSQGLLVCVFSPGESLFVYNPIALVSAVLFFALLPRLAKEPFFPMFAYGLLNGLFTLHLVYWVAQKGEISWGPRFFAHTIFLAVMPAWYGLQVIRRRWLWGVVILAGVTGAFVQFLGTLYASELDYGAIRVSTQVYRSHNGAELAWEQVLAYRTGDVERLMSEREVVIPTRFQSLPDAPKHFVPQWWWVRLLSMPEYGVPAWAVVTITSLLSVLLTGSLVALLWRR